MVECFSKGAFAVARQVYLGSNVHRSGRERERGSLPLTVLQLMNKVYTLGNELYFHKRPHGTHIRPPIYPRCTPRLQGRRNSREDFSPFNCVTISSLFLPLEIEILARHTNRMFSVSYISLFPSTAIYVLHKNYHKLRDFYNRIKRCTSSQGKYITHCSKHNKLTNKYY